MPLTRQPRQNPPYRFSFIGRWHPVKGIDLLLETLSLLTDVDWEKIETFSIAGSGILAPDIQHTCQELQQEGRPVSILGHLNARNVANLLAQTDYLVIPSRSESIPVLFSEAMQSHTPVIATPVGDLPRLLTEDEVGILTDAVDATSIAMGIRQALLTSPHACAPDMKKVASRFSVTAAVQGLLDVLHKGGV